MKREHDISMMKEILIQYNKILKNGITIKENGKNLNILLDKCYENDKILNKINTNLDKIFKGLEIIRKNSEE